MPVVCGLSLCAFADLSYSGHMRYGAVSNPPVLLTLVNPGRPKARRAAREEKKSMTRKAKRARKAPRKATRRGRRNEGAKPLTAKQIAAREAASKRKAERQGAVAGAKAAKQEVKSEIQKLQEQISALKGKMPTVRGVVGARKAATAEERAARAATKQAEKDAKASEKAAKKAEREAKAAASQSRFVLAEAKRVMGVGKRGKGGRITKRGGKRRAAMLTQEQLLALARLKGAARTQALKTMRKGILKREVWAARPKKRAKGARRTAAAWGKQMRAAGRTAERMPAWPAGRVKPPKPPAPRKGYEAVRHLVALDPWRPYVKGKGTPGWYWQPPRSGGMKYHKNPKRRHYRRNAGIIARITRGAKKFLGIKGGKKGRRNPGMMPILRDVAAGTGAFISGRLLGNLAKRSGWFGSFEQYTPFGASMVNLLAMHMLSTRVKGLVNVRGALMVGAGVQLVETAIDAFAPAVVNDFFDRPGGLGADLNVYEAALQGDLGYSGYDLGASDDELLAAVAGMGEYVALEDDMGEYVSTGEMGEYLLPADDDMGEYLLEGADDELADEVLADDEIEQLIGGEDDLAEELTEMGDEVLADELVEMGDDLGDDLGDLGATAAPPPPSIVSVSSDVPASVRKRGPRAVMHWRRMQARRGTAAMRRAAILARQGGHPAGAKPGQILTGTDSGGIFGRMAAAPKSASGLTAAKLRANVRKVIPAATAATGAAPGTPAHFATVASAVQKQVGVAVPPAATLAAYRAETAGPAAAVAAARKARTHRMLTQKGTKARVVVRRGVGGMVEFSRPTTKRALLQPRVRSVYDAPVKEDEQGIFKGDIFSGDRV
jgi:hypothetical protein